MIQRVLADKLSIELIDNQKVIIVYGARQVGKTTMLKSLLIEMNQKVLSINADQKVYHDILSSRDLKRMNELIGDAGILFIDEAQNIPDIGLNMKILHDERPELKVILTGSSSLDLANKISEPLTGRTRSNQMYPLWLGELKDTMSPFDLKRESEAHMLYGLYPEVYTLSTPDKKREHLRELVSSYLYKDILNLSGIKHADKLHKLLKLLAYQIGQLVSIQELATQLRMSHETVNSYIDLLEKSFVLRRLSGLSGNLRKEISKKDKIYFTDLGIRNAVVDNYTPIMDRPDIGGLWENYLFIERIKKCGYQSIYSHIYFWRSYDGAEVDYIEERDGTYYGFEIKRRKRKSRAPKSWLDAYGGSWKEINAENYLDFVL